MQLVVLAAGLGTRFGGLKQLAQMDEYGNCLLDYSCYDAKKAGFDSVVFIIGKGFAEEFDSTIGARVKKIMKVEYAYQDINDVPLKTNPERTKPWGTAHALYAARDVIKEDFAIINGDDFYGRDAFKVAHDYLSSLGENKEGKYANVAFMAAKTMTENGSVKRGVCFEKDGYLSKLIESSLSREEGKIIAKPLEGGDSFYIPEGQKVSMNLFCFTKDFIDRIVDEFPLWLKDRADSMGDEFLVPSFVDQLVEQGLASVKLLGTTSTWFGVTYKEDRPFVEAALRKLTEEGVYEEGLYPKN